MMLVRAIIRPERFEFVKQALEEEGIHGMTVMEVKGRGEQKGIALQYRGKKYTVDLLPKILLELVVEDEKCTMVVDTISGAARTGKIGDGRIFLLPVSRTIRIRTGEEM